MQRILSVLPYVMAWPAAAAALAGPVAAQVSPRCADAEFRQMDFWVGNWDVTDASGEKVGESTVAPMLSRCAVREEWRSGEMIGTSVNMYDKPSGVWRQMWVDNFGAVLRMEGGWSAGSMVLSGERKGADGKVRQLRVTLTPMEDGSVRQRQERSEDGGKSWTVIFDARYTSKPRMSPE